MMRSSCRRQRTPPPRSCFRKVGRRSSRTCARSSRKNTDRCRPRRGGSAPQPGSRGDAVLDVALTHHPDTAATSRPEVVDGGVDERAAARAVPPKLADLPPALGRYRVLLVLLIGYLVIGALTRVLLWAVFSRGEHVSVLRLLLAVLPIGEIGRAHV